jgi:hypothetical protein
MFSSIPKVTTLQRADAVIVDEPAREGGRRTGQWLLLALSVVGPLLALVATMPAARRWGRSAFALMVGRSVNSKPHRAENLDRTRLDEGSGTFDDDPPSE